MFIEQSFNNLFSRTTWVSQHQIGKLLQILMKREIINWTRHSRHTTSSLNFA